MALELAKVEGGRVTVSAGSVTLIAAIIAIAPPIGTAVADRLLMTKAQASTLDLETAKLELERRRAATLVLQSALANPDSAQRRILLEFLGTAKILDSAVTHLPSSAIPYWRTPAAASP